MQLKYSGKTKIAQERHISNIKKPVEIGVKVSRLRAKECTGPQEEPGRYWGYGEEGMCLCCQRENKAIRSPREIKITLKAVNTPNM